MRTTRSVLAVAGLAALTAAASSAISAPAYADNVAHRVCWTQTGIFLDVNWPVEINVRSNGTVSNVTPGSPYLSGIVPPGASIVSGSTWTHWGLTSDGHGLTVTGGATVDFGWTHFGATDDITCQAFWSF